LQLNSKAEDSAAELFAVGHRSFCMIRWRVTAL